jgi:enamine deaminase RidA (YjgF/YER057c/UK114 family)
MSIETVVTESGQFMYDNFHFAEATMSNGFLFCSGVIGVDERGQVPDEIEQEFRNAWSGVGRLLTACGIGFGDIIECTTYHVGLQAQLADFMNVRDEFLTEPWPAWTAIGVSELAVPGAHAEIRITARLRD